MKLIEQKLPCCSLRTMEELSLCDRLWDALWIVQGGATPTYCGLLWLRKIELIVASWSRHDGGEPTLCSHESIDIHPHFPPTVGIGWADGLLEKAELTMS